MKLYPFEASNGINWGKFAVGKFGAEEWAWRSQVAEPEGSLLRRSGWHSASAALWVLDLQTREGAAFRHGGYAAADLDKHRIWVCPLFLPFLTWLYTQDVTDLDALPRLVHVTDVPGVPDAVYATDAPPVPGPGPDAAVVEAV